MVFKEIILDINKSIKDTHLKNILFISIALGVLKVSNFNEDNKVQPLNILLKLITLEFPR